MSLDLELFRLTRKKSADPVARSSGQACPLHANQLHLQHYNLLQFYYILQYWSTFYFILLCARWSYPLCMYVQSYMQCQIFIFQEWHCQVLHFIQLELSSDIFQVYWSIILIVSFCQTMTLLLSKLMWETLHIKWLILPGMGFFQNLLRAMILIMTMATMMMVVMVMMMMMMATLPLHRHRSATGIIHRTDR